MSLQAALGFAFEFGDRPIQVEVSQLQLSSDAGLHFSTDGQMDERTRYQRTTWRPLERSSLHDQRLPIVAARSGVQSAGPTHARSRIGLDAD